MKPYPTYKDSNIEWLGEIPEHWLKNRLAYNGIFFKGKGISKSDLSIDGVDIILYGDLYTKYDIKTTKLERKTTETVIKKSTQVYNGDILFAASGETKEEIGKCISYLGDNEAYAGGDVVIYRGEKFDSLFLSYLFNSYKINEQKAKNSKGEIVVHIYASQLRNIPFFAPPTLKEQTQIANYLEEQTAEIDALIQAKEQLISLYEEEKKAIINQAVTKGIDANIPMKDSGIEWLGQIPEHWEVRRIKNICKVRQGLQIPIDKRLNSKEDDSLEYITIKSINNPNDPKQYVSNPSKNVICTKNDILMARTGATGIPIINVNGVFHNNFFLVDFDRKKVERMFLYYYLKSSLIYEYMLLVAGTTTIPDLNHNSFYNMPFFLFEKTEQTQIVTYIETQLALIDTKITKAKKLISLLQEYRTALINEVVTGKINITTE